jgi:hypothetical protein
MTLLFVNLYRFSKRNTISLSYKKITANHDSDFVSFIKSHFRIDRRLNFKNTISKYFNKFDGFLSRQGMHRLRGMISSKYILTFTGKLSLQFFHFFPGLIFFRGGAPHRKILLSTVCLGLLYWLLLMCSSTSFGVTHITC